MGGPSLTRKEGASSVCVNRNSYLGDALYAVGVEMGLIYVTIELNISLSMA